MLKLLKAGCLVIYGLAIAGVAGLLPPAWSDIVQKLALLLLVVHLLELFFVFKHVRRYQGPLAVSVLFTILFGLLHWMPLAKQTKGA